MYWKCFILVSDHGMRLISTGRLCWIFPTIVLRKTWIDRTKNRRVLFYKRSRHRSLALLARGLLVHSPSVGFIARLGTNL